MEMEEKKFSLASLSVKLPLFLVLFCIILSVGNGIIGYRVFRSLFERQYREVTKQVAETAVSYVNADRVNYYLKGGQEDDEWYETDEQLDILTQTSKLAYIYVTVPDSKFMTRVYIFDTVNSEVKKAKKIKLGIITSLSNYDEKYIQNLKNVMQKGEMTVRFAYNATGGHVTTSMPVIDSMGNIVAIMSIVKPMSEMQGFKESYIKTVGLSSAAITLIIVAFFTLLLMLRFFKPVSLITNETSHFAEHKGKLSDRLKKIKGKDEFGILARAIEKMSVDMNQYIADLTHTTAEKERLSAELDVATQIQANMLPRIFPPYKDHPELELFATMEPAKEVGGDFYDFFMIDGDHFALVVGDVSGKGVPAALFMVIAKTLIKNSVMQGLKPAQVFERVNNELCEGNDAGLFVTCWMGVLTLSTGELRFVNAGHTFPILRHENIVEFLKSKPDLMLAGMEGMSYHEHFIMLGRGDRLFIYTDGVTEATDADNQLYGEERLISFLRKSEIKDVRQSLADVRSDIDAFVGGVPQFDDITMLELVLKDKVGGFMIEKSFKAKDENMQAVFDFVHEQIQKDCPVDILNKIDLAVEEIFVNIAHYAYEPDEGPVNISCGFENETLTVVFSDHGKKFDPLAHADPDTSLALEEREIGGLGIYLTKQFMDSVEYEYVGDKNILTIRKKLN